MMRSVTDDAAVSFTASGTLSVSDADSGQALFVAEASTTQAPNHYFSENTVVKSPFYVPVFWWHAIRALRQAYAASGLISAQTLKISRVHHTLNLLESEVAMCAFMVNGAHLRAMKVFRRIATGCTFGFECETLPKWAEVPELWASKGRS